jgi:hypothetical protein
MSLTRGERMRSLMRGSTAAALMGSSPPYFADLVAELRFACGTKKIRCASARTDSRRAPSSGPPLL